jgi:MFS family permease
MWVGKKVANGNSIKKYVVCGFLITSIFMFSFVFLENHVVLLLIAFAIRGIGMALIEPLQELYFFKVVVEKRERKKFFGMYDTANPIMSVLGPTFASIILMFSTGLNALWFAMGCVFLIFTGVSLTIKK